MKPLLPLFAGKIISKQVSEYGIILPEFVMERRMPTVIKISAIDKSYSDKHDIRVNDIAIFQRGMLPFKQSPDDQGTLLMQVAALIAVIQRDDKPYIKMLNQQALVKVDYDKSRMINLGGVTEIKYTPADTNREEFINECVIAHLPQEADRIPLLQVGLKAWAHHFITDPQNIFTIHGEVFSRINFDSIFFVEKDGEIHPIGTNVLCQRSGMEVLEETLKSGIHLIHDAARINKQRMRANIVQAPEGSKFKEHEGKDCFFTKMCDYPIKLNGKMMFRIYERFIEGVVE